jgi:hypothetical protein
VEPSIGVPRDEHLDAIDARAADERGDTRWIVRATAAVSLRRGERAACSLGELHPGDLLLGDL